MEFCNSQIIFSLHLGRPVFRGHFDFLHLLVKQRINNKKKSLKNFRPF